MWLDAHPSISVDHLWQDTPSHLWADFWGSLTEGELHVHPGVAGLKGES